MPKNDPITEAISEWKDHQTRHTWTEAENKDLKRLLDAGINSAAFIHRKKLFPNRTLISIRSQIGRFRDNKA